MLRKYVYPALLVLFGCSLVLCSKDSSRPNIVFVMADDLGPGDVAYYQKVFQNQTSQIPTPHMDSLAESGVYFSDAHSATALCSPTRYCVMSGNMNYRSYAPWGVWQAFRPNAITVNDATLGRVAKDAGYNTAFIGKWHLGGDFRNTETGGIFRGSDRLKGGEPVDITQYIGGGPQWLGFDYSFTLPSGIQGPLYLAYENSKWWPMGTDSEIIFVDEGSAYEPKTVSDKGPGMGDSHWNTREIGKLISKKAVDFIEKQDEDTPFFLCYWSPMVHKPHMPPAEFDGLQIAGTTPSPHMDTVRDFDQQMGRIIEALKRKGVYENTLFVLTSDNGGLHVDPKTMAAGHDSSGEWRGFKNAPHEGGHRVPTIVVWPGVVEKGTINDEPIINQDMVATMAELLNVRLGENEAVDSHSFLGLLTGGEFTKREYLMLQSGSKQEVIFRKDGWKLIMQSNRDCDLFEPTALFHLTENPYEEEAQNLVNVPEHESRVKQMRAEYIKIRKSGIRTAALID